MLSKFLYQNTYTMPKVCQYCLVRLMFFKALLVARCLSECLPIHRCYLQSSSQRSNEQTADNIEMNDRLSLYYRDIMSDPASRLSVIKMSSVAGAEVGTLY